MAERRRVPPPRQGAILVILAVLLTVAVPGVGHIYAQFLTRGAIWLAGNLLMMAILMGGSVSTAAILTTFAGYRVIAAIDVAVLCRSSGSPAGDRGSGA